MIEIKGTPDKLMTVRTILRRVTESIDFDTPATHNLSNGDWWLMMMESKCSDTGFGYLVNSLITKGWNASISAVTLEDIGNGDLAIMEGHHRLFAAILLGMDVVPVSSRYRGPIGRPAMPSAYDYEDDPWGIDI